jgi:hypothetical protein
MYGFLIARLAPLCGALQPIYGQDMASETLYIAVFVVKGFTPAGPADH